MRNYFCWIKITSIWSIGVPIFGWHGKYLLQKVFIQIQHETNDLGKSEMLVLNYFNINLTSHFYWPNITWVLLEWTRE